MGKVKLTIVESRCRSGCCKAGDVFMVGDICPPVCMELWHAIYPYVFALRNGALLDADETKAQSFTGKCPDGERVVVKGELVD